MHSGMKKTSLGTKPAGLEKALRLFHRAAREVPAYADFLRKKRIDPDQIDSADAFAKIPPTTKENYITRYPLADRSWGGSLKEQKLFAVSSGTSGEPTIWPRGEAQEREAQAIHERLYDDLFAVSALRTLIIVGYPMGMYVSGIATVLPTWSAIAKKPHVSMVTVGNSKESFLIAMAALGDEFEQMLLIGHPFFIKDVLETARDRKMKIKARIRGLFCSEGFNEAWRDHLARLAPGADAASDFFNTYGSSEFLLVGHENPLTISIRRLAEKEPAVCKTLFGSAAVPNLFQYDPEIRYIETMSGDLVITAHAGVPLIRFNQHDAGAVLPYDAMVQALTAATLQRMKSARAPWRGRALPFVTLSGRSDRTVVFYAANIYPEHIMEAMNDPAYLGYLTGKFVMEKKYLSDMEQELIIHTELRPEVRKSAAFAHKLEKHIATTLARINMEYRHLRSIGQKHLDPRVDLRPYQDSTHFKPGLKPRYIAK